MTLLLLLGFMLIHELRPRGPPPLLEAISANQLVLFLLANMLTGLVNMACRTLLQPLHVTALVMVGYMALNCGVAALLHHQRIFIKL